jgi:hypothetical protein
MVRHRAGDAVADGVHCFRQVRSTRLALDSFTKSEIHLNPATSIEIAVRRLVYAAYSHRDALNYGFEPSESESQPAFHVARHHLVQWVIHGANVDAHGCHLSATKK